MSPNTPRYSPSGPPLVVAAGSFDPIFHQFWLDTTKPDGGSGSIGQPFNQWAQPLQQMELSGNSSPWITYLAQGLDATGTPVPNVGVGGHESASIRFVGVTPLGFSPDSLANVTVNSQDNGSLVLEFDDLLVVTLAFNPQNSLTLVARDSWISGVSELTPGTVFGRTQLQDTVINQWVLPSLELDMEGGAVDLNMEVRGGTLNGVTFRSGVVFRFHFPLQLTNCIFEAGAQLLCDANQQLNVDLTTWGYLKAAGVTFPDTTPTITITPWVPIIGQALKGGNTTVATGGVLNVNVGQIAPIPAQPDTACIATFGNVQNSQLSPVGSFINGAGELIVMVVNHGPGSVDLVDVLFNVSYLPRISP